MTFAREPQGPERYERRLESAAGWGSAYAQASREVRAAWNAADPHRRALVEVAAGVAAPLLIEYVRWILLRAEEQGLDRLYFLARDGQVLLRIARLLAPYLGDQVSLHYLYVSRVSLNLAAAGGLDASTSPWVLTGLRRLNRVEFGSRLHLEDDEVSAALAGTDLSGWGEEPLGKDRAPLLEEVLRRPEVKALLRERALTQRRAALGYLRSCGFLADGEVGVVDLGGAGSQLVSLAELRRSAAVSTPAAFLLYRERSQLASSSHFQSAGLSRKVHTFVQDAVLEPATALVSGFVPMVETFCAADHGRVQGYVVRGEAAEPILAESNQAQLETWGLPQIRAALDGVALRVAPGSREAPRGMSLTVLLANMEDLLRHPRRVEAHAWGSFPVQGGVTGEASQLAPRFRFADLVSQLSSRTSGTTSRWFAGSRARSCLCLRVLWHAGDSVRRRVATHATRR